MQPSLVDGLAAFTTRLDGLRADQNPDELSHVLWDAFKQRVLYNLYVFSLSGDTERAKVLLEVFDNALQATTYSAPILKRFRQLCGRTGLLPTSYIIPGELIQTAGQPVASGAFGDVWEGTYKDKQVAIKALRVFKEGSVRKVTKAFCEEVVTWRWISHPNIVPFLGVSETRAPLCIVSEWMPNGNVRDYVGKNPETSRLQFLLEISRGLSFLHSLEIVHGDLKGDNILVDRWSCARLNDFGFAGITSLSCARTPASRLKGAQRWMAPELFSLNDGEVGLPTRESDIFALGMITFEVFTGQMPFLKIKSLAVVMKNIIDGERPPRPRRGRRLGLSDEFWELIRSSLAHDAGERPSASAFVDFLESVTPDIAVLKELAEFDANSEVHTQKLRQMFEYGDNTLFGMREEGALAVIEVFDRVLNSSLNDPTLQNQCLYGLQKVSARCGIVPKSYMISLDSLTGHNDAPSATGRVSKTRQWLIDGRLVAVKTINSDYIESFDAFKHRLCTNMVVWKRLQHTNVVDFLGFGSGYPPFSLVYHWMPNGNLSEYLRKYPDANKLSLLLGVARGLTYLHRHNLAHGNLTGRNILVGSDGVACISEYNLETVLRDGTYPKSIPTNVRWMAPEVLGTKDGYIPPGDGGKASDIYSFAVVMFETLTGTIPFPNESDEEVVDKVVTGRRPMWPPNSPCEWPVDELWEQIRACWDQVPNERPDAFEVLQKLVALSAQRQEPVMHTEGQAMTKEQEHVGDYPEGFHPERKEHREHHDSNSLSGHTLVSLSPVPKTHSTSDTRNQGGPKRRFGPKVGKHVRGLLSFAKQGSEEGNKRREPVGGKLTPGIEIIDQREEEVVVRDDCVSYIVSRPIPEGKTLKKVVITVVSKDQGWTNYPEDYGTYHNSWTWFELSVGSPSKDSGEKWRGEVVKNLHAHGDFKEHTIEIQDGELYERAKSGDVLTVWAVARSQGWKNTVKKVTIRYVVE